MVSVLTKKFIVSEFTAEGREQLLTSLTPSAIAGYIKSGFRYHVAEGEDEIVGVIGIRDNSHLFHLFVAESHQGRGLARRLWEKGMQESLWHGNPGEFTVNSSRNAQPVYEHFGFVAQSGPMIKRGVTFTPMRLKLSPANKS
ncbi:MAG: GNAT family N-acetyltransferase [Lysobacterales bacterium]